MKRAVVLVCIAAIALSMLAVVAGCGGDPNKDEAKQLMNSGDAYMDAVAQATTELQSMQEDLASQALGGDTSALTGEGGAALGEQVAGILDDIRTNLEAAKAEYQKILALDGVQDYKDYASKMIEAIDVYAEQLDYTDALVTKLEDALTAMAAGQDIDIITMMMNSEELTKVDELGKQGDDLVEEANQIKLDKKLED